MIPLTSYYYNYIRGTEEALISVLSPGCCDVRHADEGAQCGVGGLQCCLNTTRPLLYSIIRSSNTRVDEYCSSYKLAETRVNGRGAVSYSSRRAYCTVTNGTSHHSFRHTVLSVYIYHCSTATHPQIQDRKFLQYKTKVKTSKLNIE